MKQLSESISDSDIQDTASTNDCRCSLFKNQDGAKVIRVAFEMEL